MARILIKNGYVVTMNRQRDVFRTGSLLLDGEHIEKVEAGDIEPVGSIDSVIDASGMIVIPGLINVHQHFYCYLFKVSRTDC
jgi:5-methylthioadenosine/S-adenosylhomocysteine deaminase